MRRKWFVYDRPRNQSKEQSMSGEDDDYLEDIVVTVISVFAFLLLIAAIGSIVWALIS